MSSDEKKKDGHVCALANKFDKVAEKTCKTEHKGTGEIEQKTKKGRRTRSREREEKERKSRKRRRRVEREKREKEKREKVKV